VSKAIIQSGIFLLIGCVLAANQVVSANEVRDPTMPLGQVSTTATKVASQWRLNAVLISPQRKLAVINGSTLHEGQVIPGSSNIKVQRIMANAVVLQQAAQTWVVKLSPSVVKKNSTIKHNN
jgi:MSHA biogenesis protein MshK